MRLKNGESSWAPPKCSRRSLRRLIQFEESLDCLILETQRMAQVFFVNNFFARYLLTGIFIDSPESVKRESAIIFPQFDVDKWYRDEEEIFRKNQIEFIKGNFVHKVSGRLKNDLNCVELEMNKLNKTTKYLQDLHYASALTNTFGFWKILITSSRRRNSSSISIFLFLFFNVSLLTGIEFSSLIKAA
jgi:hypothetical protein